MLLASNKTTTILVETLSNLVFWGAIIAACFVIFLGFLFQRKKFIIDNWEKPLVRIILLVGLPAMVFKSFMVNLDLETFKNMLVLLILGILFYVMMSFGSRIFFLKTGKGLQDTLSMCVAFSSTVYFGLPIAEALFSGPNQLVELRQAANIFNVGFWVFMCSYALYIIRRKVDGVSLDGKNLKTPQGGAKRTFTKNDWKVLFFNPIIISLIVGMLLWIMQLIPGINMIHVTNDGWNTIEPGYYSITRIDALIPGVKPILTVLAALPTPLAWLAVGAVMAKCSLKSAIQNKLVWYTSLLKVLFVPLVTLGLLALFALIGAKSGMYKISNAALVVIVLMSASPTATTIAGYAILYNKESYIASQVCTLTTILTAFTMPVWAVVAALVGSGAIFGQV